MGHPVSDDVFSDGDLWPDMSDSDEQWVAFAVTRGVAKAAAQAMSKQNLIKALLRLDNSSE